MSGRRPLLALVSLPTLGLGLGLALGVAHAGEGKEVRKKAIAACQKKQVGDDCDFKVGGDEKRGKCRKTPHGAVACVPHEMHAKWQKARHACNGKKAGDGCGWSHEGEQVEGTCVDSPRGDGLVCKPAQ